MKFERWEKLDAMNEAMDYLQSAYTALNGFEEFYFQDNLEGMLEEMGVIRDELANEVLKSAQEDAAQLRRDSYRW